MCNSRHHFIGLLWLVVGIALWAPQSAWAGYPPEQLHYWRTVMPIMKKYCNIACHNADDNKGGLNLNNFDFILSIQKQGDIFLKVIQQVDEGVMPPKGKPQLTPQEKDTLLVYLHKYLADAVAELDPDIIPAHRLNNRQYAYALEDLTGVQVDVNALFPKDPGGGEGFDNHAGALFMSSLEIDLYFDMAEKVIETMRCDELYWRKYVPRANYSLVQKLAQYWNRLLGKNNIENHVIDHARLAIGNFTTLAFRRHLSPEESNQLVSFFKEVYLQTPHHSERFDESIKEVFKAVLVSPNFLMIQEEDPPADKPYLISNFELASRLSFFLWSSLPDDTLLNAAYTSDLHHPLVLHRQIDRMLGDKKRQRFAESFSTQWLEIDRLEESTHEIDGTLFPEYQPKLKQAMLQEAVSYFDHVLNRSRNLLELLNGDYTFLNQTLAEHYGIGGIQGDSMRYVNLPDGNRGGVVGMAGVLTSTSLPNRTSPVLRGKWIMEKILATPAKPPPPNTPALEAAKGNVHDELSLRELLALHRDKDACRGCHQDMDDLGFALENFDPIGRWRSAYKTAGPEIDVTGKLKSGEFFEGPQELKVILVQQKDRFAKAISKKLLGYALGRSIVFKDFAVVDQLTQILLEHNFDPVPWIYAVVDSYPFRYKKSDPVIIDPQFGD